MGGSRSSTVAFPAAPHITCVLTLVLLCGGFGGWAWQAVLYLIRLFWDCVDLAKDAHGCVRRPAYLEMSVKLQKACECLDNRPAATTL